MASFKLLRKQLLVNVLIVRIEPTEPLSYVTVVSEVGAILHATFEHHVTEFKSVLTVTGPHLQFKQLVATFFEVDGRHDN